MSSPGSAGADGGVIDSCPSARAGPRDPAVNTHAETRDTHSGRRTHTASSTDAWLPDTQNRPDQTYRMITI